jgi:DNA-directed RNA polymerase specialized sigma24 family protein
LIFEYYIYYGFEAEEIASQLGLNLTAKRVENLIREIKQALRQCLHERGIGR